MNTCRYPNAFVSGRRRMMRDAASSDILAVWKRAAPRNRMREIFTSGSVGGLASNRWLYLDLALSEFEVCEIARGGSDLRTFVRESNS